MVKIDEYIDENSTGKLNTSGIISSMIGNAKGKEVGDSISLDNQITSKANALGQRLLR